MRREFLKNLGIEDKEIIDKILDENMTDIGVAKGKSEADKEHLEKQITELTAQLKERDSQLEKLKDVDVDKLNGEIERLQAENKTAKEESDKHERWEEIGVSFNEQEKFNYQGKAYDFIGFDEVTHFTRSQYMYMMSRNRPTGPGTRVYMRATCNPDGKGLAWVKERFITPAPAGKRMFERYPIKQPNGEEIWLKRDRIFIQSSIFDNQKLLDNDPNYLANLAALPEAEKNALLYGKWDSFSGQVFTEWRNDSEHYQDRIWTHVIEPFRIPEHWKIYRGYDFGYAKPYSVGWYAVDEKGKIYRIKELYGWNGVDNTGLKENPIEQARRIREAEQNDPILRGRKDIIGVADPAIFDESRGESIARMMERSPNFIYFHGGDHTRLPHERWEEIGVSFNKNLSV